MEIFSKLFILTFLMMHYASNGTEGAPNDTLMKYKLELLEMINSNKTTDFSSENSAQYKMLCRALQDSKCPRNDNLEFTPEVVGLHRVRIDTAGQSGYIENIRPVRNVLHCKFEDPFFSFWVIRVNNGCCYMLYEIELYDGSVVLEMAILDGKYHPEAAAGASGAGN